MMIRVVKNFVVSGFLFTLGSTVLADGLYAGMEGGYTTTTIKKDNTIFYSQVYSNFTPDIHLQLTSPAEGGLIGLYTGYGKKFNNFYLATELDGTVNTAKAHTTDDNFISITADLTEKLQRSLGVSLIPGYYITDSSLIYGKVGGVWSRFESNSYSAGYEGASGDFSKNLLGTRLGVGMETYITSQISLRGEYDYTLYHSFEVKSMLPIIEDVSVPTSTRYNLHNQQFLLGLSYHFE